MIGPSNPVCDSVHAEKYRGPGESFKEAMNRVAAALQDNHNHYHAFREILFDMRFLPAGRVQAAMGSLKNVTAYNCFVAPTIEDSFGDGENSIMGVAHKAALTMRQGGGIGYDFSTLRPKGDLIRGVMARTDGPLAFMPIYDAVCRATSSAGNRRGAQMGILRVDHPDVEAFIHAKQTPGVLTGFNVSVAVTDKFIQAVKAGSGFDLTFKGEVYRTVDAGALWEMLMRSTYDYAEPGVIFIDRINEMNNLWYCERIAATNPCGEQPLPPNGACLLGSINLPKYLVPVEGGGWSLDLQQILDDIPLIHAAMDNIVDRAQYPLPEQREEALSKRRMGIGVTGLANALEACGYPYGTPEAVMATEEWLREIAIGLYQASMARAQYLGKPFPLFDPEKFGKQGFASKLPQDLLKDIAKYGIRNSHLTSIAPTGTISFTADNVSSGIEPVFSTEYERDVIREDGKHTVIMRDYGVEKLGVKPRKASEVTPIEHVDMLCAAQAWVDSAVSKTVNVPTNIAWDDFAGVYLHAWENGAKGCTTYRPRPVGEDVRGSVLRDIADNPSEELVCSIGPDGRPTGPCAES